MFAFLRKLIFPIIIVVLFFFVAMIVLQWGADITRSGRPEDSVGSINGQNITIAEYDQYYTKLHRQEQENTEGDLTPEKVEEIREQAWSQLVADNLIQREIAKYEIYVTPEEIYTFLKMYPPTEIQQFPQFMTDGKFDYQKYVNAMVAPENAAFWAQIEAYVLPDLQKYKLQEVILNTVRITPAEVLDAFMAEKDKIKIGFINVPSAKLEATAPVPTEEESKAYYDANMDDYKQPKRATINMVAFDKKPSDNDWDFAYYIIKDIYDSAIAGADFAILAKDYSEDNSAQKGGDLGWFNRGRMVPAFDSACWAMEVDEISQPIKTKFGWHVIKLTGKKTEEETPRGKDKPEMVEKRQASHVLLKVRASQETLDQLFANSQDFIDAALETGLETAAEEYNYEITESAPFVEGGYVQYIGQNEAANKFVFDNKPGKVGDPIETKTAYYIYAVASHIPEKYTPFEDAKNAIERKLKRDIAKSMAVDTAKIMYESIISGNSFKKTADQYGFSYNLSDMLTRASTIPAVGKVPEVTGAAYALQNINAISPPINYDRGSVILTLLDRTTPNLDEFNEVQDSLYFAVLQKKHQDIYNRWFNSVMASAEIEKDLERFYRGY